MQYFILGTFVAIAVLAQPLSLNAVDVESTKESCFDIKETVSVNMTWLASYKTLYYPLMSRYELYHMGVELTGKNAKDIREDEFYYDSCFVFEPSKGGFRAEGFGGKQAYFTLTEVKEGLEVFKLASEGSEAYNDVTCYTTLTDNKTFAVAAACTSNNLMVWSVLATVKKLPKKTVEKIYDHVESLGFKREHFTGIRYNSCNLGKKKDKKTEL